VTRTYLAEIEWDAASKQWLATVPELKGAHTHARTIAGLKAGLREVVVLAGDRPDEDLHDMDAFEVKLLLDLVPPIKQALEVRAVAARSEDRARAATHEAVAWTRVQGIGMRDAAELLGISHQRVAQLAETGRALQLTVTDDAGLSDAAAIVPVELSAAERQAAAAARRENPPVGEALPSVQIYETAQGRFAARLNLNDGSPPTPVLDSYATKEELLLAVYSLFRAFDAPARVVSAP